MFSGAASMAVCGPGWLLLEVAQGPNDRLTTGTSRPVSRNNPNKGLPHLDTVRAPSYSWKRRQSVTNSFRQTHPFFRQFAEFRRNGPFRRRFPGFPGRQSGGKVHAEPRQVLVPGAETMSMVRIGPGSHGNTGVPTPVWSPRAAPWNWCRRTWSPQWSPQSSLVED